MLTGGSTVCCVDECTSGLDPLSRRKIWDILMAERGKRTIIFTTHFLDEADILADHIAILSKGTLRAEGSSVELKDKLGGGYRIHCYNGPGHKKAPLIADMKTEVSFDQTLYLAQTCSQAVQVVKAFEREGIDDYTISGPTIEDVFLQLAEEARTESETESIDEVRIASPVDEGQEKDGPIVNSLALNRSTRLELLPGSDLGFSRQGWVLFRKRFTLLRRNYFPYIAAFIIPIITAALVTRLVKGQTIAGCLPTQQVSNFRAQNLANQVDYNLLVGPSSKFQDTNVSTYLANLLSPFSDNVLDLLPLLPNKPELHIVNTSSQVQEYINIRYANVTPGAYFLGDANDPPLIAYLADTPEIYSSLFVQNVLNQMLMNLTIVTQYKSFDIPWAANTGNSLQLVVYFGLVMAATPAFFALYPTIERLRNVRGLQYSNGVRAIPLWLSYAIFDYIIVLSSTSISMVLFTSLSSVWWNLGYLYLVLILFNMTSILLSYVVSLYARSQLSAFAIAAGGQAIFFLIYLIAYLCTITYAPVAKVDDYLQIVHFTVSIITPMGSLIRSLFLSVNLFSTTCVGNSLSNTPGGIKQYGGPILYLILQSIALFCVLLLHDGGSLWVKFRRSKPVTSTTETGDVGPDGNHTDELNRTSSDDCLSLLHVTKNFKKNTAVEDLTFGIPRGEVFALVSRHHTFKTLELTIF
jgi:ATP-binding cassette subfamily A (ABC1) protein 3